MIEISVIKHHLDGRTAESIASATISEDGRVTAWSGKVRTQTLVECYTLLQDIWHGVEEISRAIAEAQQTTTTRERPKAPVVRRPGVAGMRACFRRTRVPAITLFDDLAAGLPLAEFLATYPSVSRDIAIQAIHRARSLLERDAPLDIREGQ
jgi:uncharacterized protein (DUF433 family)